MKEYEYRVVTQSGTHLEDGYLEEWLNEMGEQGWFLQTATTFQPTVGVVARIGGLFGITFVFIRDYVPK